tara:strand:- start:522 stop:902 length:381 start_codon:yes stop_codon:yes gene_type:complete
MNLPIVSVGLGILSSSYILFSKKEQFQSWLDKNLGGNLIDTLGYLGGALQLGAVMAVSRDWLKNTSKSYHLLSLVGSTGLLATAFYHGAMAPTLVNIIWMGMNVVGIIESTSNTKALGLITEQLPI